MQWETQVHVGNNTGTSLTNGMSSKRTFLEENTRAFLSRIREIWYTRRDFRSANEKFVQRVFCLLLHYFVCCAQGYSRARVEPKREVEVVGTE